MPLKGFFQKLPARKLLPGNCPKEICTRESSPEKIFPQKIVSKGDCILLPTQEKMTHFFFSTLTYTHKYTHSKSTHIHMKLISENVQVIQKRNTGEIELSEVL